MTVRAVFVAALGASLLWSLTASADPWKDESGHGRRLVSPVYVPAPVTVVVPLPPAVVPYPYSYGAYGDIPSGHLPPPGECRRWYPGVPAGHQPPPGPC